MVILHYYLMGDFFGCLGWNAAIFFYFFGIIFMASSELILLQFIVRFAMAWAFALALVIVTIAHIHTSCRADCCLALELNILPNIHIHLNLYRKTV